MQPIKGFHYRRIVQCIITLRFAHIKICYGKNNKCFNLKYNMKHIQLISQQGDFKK